MARRTLLLDGVYWPSVGHAVEALQHAFRYHRGDPAVAVSVVLNRHTAVELTTLCPWLDATYTVDIGNDRRRVGRKLWRDIPREWDFVVDDPRTDPSRPDAVDDVFLDYGRGSRRRLEARVARSTWDDGTLPYAADAYLRLEVAPAELESPRPRVAVVPAGSHRPERYPSRRSWELIVDALARELDASFVYAGRLGGSAERTRTAIDRSDVDALLERHPGSVDCFDRPLLDQLAHVAACDLLISPHTGFAYAGLTVGTPWLTISGGRWSEYFMAGVPFHSVMPDASRFPWHSERHMTPVADGDDGPRVVSMLRERIEEDLPEIVRAAGALAGGRWPFEECERRHWPKIEALNRSGLPA
jgi:hypothetical protein